MTRKFNIAAPAMGMAAFFTSSPAFAHCFVGPRFFPATLAVHDPCVNDELSFVGGSGLVAAHGHGGGHGHGTGTNIDGDVSAPRDYGVMGEFQKRITQDFAVSVEFGVEPPAPARRPQCERLAQFRSLISISISDGSGRRVRRLGRAFSRVGQDRQSIGWRPSVYHTDADDFFRQGVRRPS